MDNNNPLVKLDQGKQLLDAIRTSNLPELQKQTLEAQLLSNEAAVRNAALVKLADSGIAQVDIGHFLGELAAINKKGMYATAKLEAKTGSGKVEMQFKGGDTKLIVPVLAIVAIIVIAILIIMSMGD